MIKMLAFTCVRTMKMLQMSRNLSHLKSMKYAGNKSKTQWTWFYCNDLTCFYSLRRINRRAFSAFVSEFDLKGVICYLALVCCLTDVTTIDWELLYSPRETVHCLLMEPLLPPATKLRQGNCNSMPLVRLGRNMCVVKCSYFLVRHCVSKITLLFYLGGSCQSLKVREVKCVPGDPATTCPVLFKGPAPCCY